MEVGERQVGRPSRAAAACAVKAHLAVLQGDPLRRAIGEALDEKLGGKERRFAAYAARELSRHQRWLDATAKAKGLPFSSLNLEGDRAIWRYALWRTLKGGADAERALTEIALPGPVRPRSIPDAVIAKHLAVAAAAPEPPDPLEKAAFLHSFPAWLAQAIAASVGPQALEPVLEALNREPVLMLRARRPVGPLLEALAKEGHQLSVDPSAPGALVQDDEGRAIFDSPAMKQGHLQVMDVGSQALAALCRALPGQTAIDYCAGAGGKTIALADAVGPTGHVEAWDKNPGRLKEARRRTRELSLRQVSFPERPRLAGADVVLIDAPCSGTGTLAREPDQKWKLTADKVKTLVSTQRQILGDVAKAVKPGAVVVYGTCSILRDENDAQLDWFLEAHPRFELDGAPLTVLPHQSAGGGFFGARLIAS